MRDTWWKRNLKRFAYIKIANPKEAPNNNPSIKSGTWFNSLKAKPNENIETIANTKVEEYLDIVNRPISTLYLDNYTISMLL